MAYILTIKIYILSIPGLRKQCTQIPQTDLHKRNVFSHNSGSWKYKIEVLAILISDTTSPLGLKTLLLYWHTAFAPCVLVVSPSLFLYDSNTIIRGATLWPLFTLITTFKALCPNTIIMGDRASAYKFLFWAHSLQNVQPQNFYLIWFAHI